MTNEMYLPPEFKLFEPADSWVDDRWVVGFDGKIGSPAQAVTVGAASRKGPARAIVRTEEPVHGPLDTDPHEFLSIVALSLMWPDRHVELPPSHGEPWPLSRWKIGGREVAAHRYAAGDRWCGYWFDHHGDAPTIFVAGSGVVPELMSLRQVITDAYRFDPSQDAPLAVPVRRVHHRTLPRSTRWPSADSTGARTVAGIRAGCDGQLKRLPECRTRGILPRHTASSSCSIIMARVCQRFDACIEFVEGLTEVVELGPGGDSLP